MFFFFFFFFNDPAPTEIYTLALHDALPIWMTYAVPARYFIPPLTSVFVVGDLWPMFVRSILAMLGFGLLFFGLAFRVTRRRIA